MTAENSDASPYEIADVYAALREKVFALDPTDIGLNAVEHGDPWGLVMETGYAEPSYVVTLLAMKDGSVSIYFSPGGAVIGSGAHEGPARVSRELLSLSERFLPEATNTTTWPFPEPGMTRFYFLTFDGVLLLKAEEDVLDSYMHRLSPLFQKAHELITEIRILDEQRAAEAGEPPPGDAEDG